MKKDTRPDTADKIVEAIVKHIKNTSMKFAGWNEITAQAHKEIREDWRNLVKEILDASN